MSSEDNPYGGIPTMVVVATVTAVVTTLATGAVSEASAANGGTLSLIGEWLGTVDRWVAGNLTWLLFVACVPSVAWAALRVARLVRERRLPFTGAGTYYGDDATAIVFAIVRWSTAVGVALVVRVAVDAPWPSVAAVMLFVVGLIRVGNDVRRLFLF